MKKIKLDKSHLMCSIVVAILFSSISVVSAYSYFANNMVYKPKDTKWNVNNVNDAINSLYDIAKNNKMIGNYEFADPLYETSQGTALSTRTGNITLNKGKYIVIVSRGNNYSNSGSYSSSYGPTVDSITCSIENNCSIRMLSSYYNHIKPTSTSSGYFDYLDGLTSSYYVDVYVDNQTLSYDYNLGWSHSSVGQFVTFQAIPLE